jgi:hypothetical protein
MGKFSAHRVFGKLVRAESRGNHIFWLEEYFSRCIGFVTCRPGTHARAARTLLIRSFDRIEASRGHFVSFFQCGANSTSCVSTCSSPAWVLGCSLRDCGVMAGYPKLAKCCSFAAPPTGFQHAWGIAYALKTVDCPNTRFGLDRTPHIYFSLCAQSGWSKPLPLRDADCRGKNLHSECKLTQLATLNGGHVIREAVAND